MKPYIILIPVILLIIVLSIMSGGVTPEIRPVAISGGILIFIISLLVVAFSSSYSLSSGKPFLVPLVLLLASIVVQAAAPVLMAGRIPLLEIVAYSLLASAIMLSHPSPRAVVFFILSLAAWGVIMVGYGLARRLSIAGEISNISVAFINRNHFCAFIGMMAPLSLGLALWVPGRLIRWLSVGLFLVLSAGVILTGSRGGVMAFGVSIVVVMVLYLLRQKGNKRVWIYLLLAAIVGGILIAVLFLPVRGALPTITETSFSELSVRTRFSIWQSTFRAFLDRPWTGWGWGSFRYIYPLFKAPGVWYKVPHAHNELLQLLAEGGLVGFFAVVLCYVYASVRLTGSFFRENRKTFRALFSGSVGVLVYALIHSCFDFIFRLPANAFLFAGIIGLGLSIDLPGRRGIILSRKTARLISSGLIILLAGLVFFPMIKYFRSRRIYQQGLKNLALSRPERARADFSAAIDIEPEDSDYYLSRARAGIWLFENSNDKIRSFEDIQADLDRAEEENPWDATIPWTRGLFYRRLHAYRKAEEAMEEALRRDPTNPFILMDQARIDLSRERLDSAASRLHRAAVNYPCVGPACINLMIAATDDYRVLRRVPPALDWLHRQLGGNLVAMGLREEAEQEFREAIVLNPDSHANWMAMGKFLLLMDRFRDSREAFEKALSLRPLDGWTWFYLGDVSNKSGEKEKALGYYRRALSLQPGNRKFIRKVFSLLKEVERRSAARRFLISVAAENPGWGWPCLTQAELSLETADYEQATREISEALRREPDHPYYLKLKKRIDVLLNTSVNK